MALFHFSREMCTFIKWLVESEKDGDPKHIADCKSYPGRRNQASGLAQYAWKKHTGFIQNIYIIQEPVFLHVFVRLIALNFGM